MKKNLTLIALAATALFCSCGNSGTAETPQQEEKHKVKIAQVTTQEVPQFEEYATTVEAKVKNNIIPNSALRISRILVEVGDNVRKGQKLVELDASSLDQLKLQVENQEIDFKRIEELYKIGGESKAVYDNAKTQLEINKKALANKLENTVLTSPIDGVVSARNYDNGDIYGSKPILVVEQISPVKMKINVSESRYAQTSKQQPVTLKFNSYGNEEFTGKIDIVYPTIDAATHTFPVEITLANKDCKVRPGMYGHVTVNYGSVSHVVVPDQAVVKQAGAGDYYVYTYENGKVTYNKVEIGRRIGDKYELLSGIENGSYVVVAGHTGLNNGKEVEVIE